MSRLGRNTKQYIGIVFLSLLVIGSAFIAAYIFILRDIKRNYGVELNRLSSELKTNQHYVYETNCDIEAGTCLTDELVTYRQVYTSQAGETFLSKEDLGKMTIIDLPRGVFLQKSMVTSDELPDGLREIFYDCIRISDNIDATDYIDVRIVLPNGENYIVLAKHAIKRLSEDRTQCCMWLSEEEILQMSSAIVDAYLYSGAYLYTTKYILPSLQDSSISNYQPSLACMELIQNNPNVVTEASNQLNKNMRKSMENRLASSMNTRVEEIDWTLNNNMDHKSTENNTEHEIENNTEASKQEEDCYFTDEVKAKGEDVEYGE